MVGHVVSHTRSGAGLGAKLSYYMMQPLTGVPLLLLMLWGMYKVLGEWVAGVVVNYLELTIMGEHFVPFVQDTIARVAAEGSVPFTLLAGEFGILTMTPTYLIAVILPLVSGFYLLLSIMEDTGYLPRIAALADRSLGAIGLNGRAVIPLILGLGCVTMGTLTTRILGTRRERVIATALMAIAVPCSAQIAVIAALMGRVGAGYAIGYVAAIFAVFVGVGTALASLTPGETSDLLIDLPPLRVPRVDNVLRKTVFKVWYFMKEVTIFFVAGAALISTLQVTGAIDWIQRAVSPLMVSWLHLPEEAATAFVMGFVRRDFGATGFFLMDLTPVQLLVGMVTITLFVPCFASILVIFKERGAKYMVGLLFASTGLAFLLGGLLTRLLEVF
jgi:ferrous iron transport protein B